MLKIVAPFVLWQQSPGTDEHHFYNMLEGVRNKDLGKAGAPLNDMIAAIRGFDIDELNPNQKLGFFARLFGKAKPVSVFLSKYDDVRKQINNITDKMEEQKTQLLTDIISRTSSMKQIWNTSTS